MLEDMLEDVLEFSFYHCYSFFHTLINTKFKHVIPRITIVDI